MRPNVKTGTGAVMLGAALVLAVVARAQDTTPEQPSAPVEQPSAPVEQPSAPVKQSTVAPEAAETPGDASTEPSGRYVMKDIADGILRMDTQTGQVSHCRTVAGDWACNAVSDDRGNVEAQVSSLRKENEQLRARLAETEKARKPTEQEAVKLPEDAEMDRVMAFLEKFMRRFFEFARSMRDTLGRSV